MRIDEKGWIVLEPQDPAWLQIERIPTQRTRPLEPRGSKPRRIVWHYTEVCGDMRALCRRIVPVPGRASWHALIARPAAPPSGILIIYQCAPFLVGTWHVAGPPRGVLLDGKPVNAQTLGVEVENWGRVRRDAEGRRDGRS